MLSGPCLGRASNGFLTAHPCESPVRCLIPRPWPAGQTSRHDPDQSINKSYVMDSANANSSFVPLTPLPLLGRARHLVRPTKVSEAKAVTLCSATLSEDGKSEPPLGPLYIASALESAGVEVDFRDFQLHEEAHCFSGDELAHFLAGHEAIVAISCFVDMLPAVVDAVRRLS